jgi:SAM-dependent methyltransferase
MINAPSGEAHWESVYSERKPTEVSWFEKAPAMSLRLIAAADLPPAAALLDVGAGASRLAAALIATGYEDVTVADISATALLEAKRLPGTDRVKFTRADVRNHDFGRGYDLWHDRALFHFMVSDADQSGYLATLHRTLRPGGHLIIATFGPDGPTRCSSLPVARYGAEDLSNRLGREFDLVSAGTEVHITPSGNQQQFLYAHFRRIG